MARPRLDRPKVPTMHQKVEVYERLLHDLHFHSTVTMRPEAVKKLLQRIGEWSYAHRAGNGEKNEKQVEDEVNHAFWKLGDDL